MKFAVEDIQYSVKIKYALKLSQLTIHGYMAVSDMSWI